MTPERFQKADKLFNGLHPKDGEVPLDEIASVVSAWDSAFSAVTVEATFHTCGATLGRVTRDAWYRWVYSVWSGLSDEVPPPQLCQQRITVHHR